MNARSLRHPSIGTTAKPPVLAFGNPSVVTYAYLVDSLLSADDIKAATSHAFGRDMRQFRDRMKLDRPQLAARIGISKNQLRDLEDGGYYPEHGVRARLFAMCKGLESWRTILSQADQAIAFRKEHPVSPEERGQVEVKINLARNEPIIDMRIATPPVEPTTEPQDDTTMPAAAPTPIETVSPSPPSGVTPVTTLFAPTKETPFHIALWNLRTQAGHSRADVASVLDVTEWAVEQWECASNNPIRSHYDALCNLLPGLSNAKAPPVRDIPKPTSGPRSLRPATPPETLASAAPVGDLRNALQMLRTLDDIRAVVASPTPGPGVESLLWLLRSAAASSMSAAEVLALVEGK